MVACTERRMAVSSHVLNAASIICLATSMLTNHWLLTEERIPEESATPHFMLTKAGTFVQSNTTYWNRTTFSGMFAFCTRNVYPSLPEQPADCFWIDHHIPDHTRLVDARNATTCVIYATIISMPSLVSAAAVTFIGMVTNMLIRVRKIWVFITGIIYITAGICTFTCLVLYITYVVQELEHKHDEKSEDGEDSFQHWYGYSSILAMVSFCCQELGGISLVYLSIFQFKAHWDKKERQEQGRQLQLNNYPFNRNPDYRFPGQPARSACNHVEARGCYSSLDQIEMVPLYEQRAFYNSRNPYDTCLANCSPKLSRKSLTVPDLDVRTRDVYVGNHVGCSYNTPYCPSYYPPDKRKAAGGQNPRYAAPPAMGRLPRQVTFSDEELDAVEPRQRSFAAAQFNLPNATYAQPRRHRPLRTSSLRMTPV
ncbi:uncharacterized protein LOC129584308 [Paramacrobiotus metropolitanus]|uniref:uncharacterized protein LOC129584308 n=1 Tax=Paramacrobiotus metropolitanus TaxID=2943436 RepID=UPI00244595DC|nr:uncharacterized protein LOC129584308 [Paramacrobiotus metropolitanus]